MQALVFNCGSSSLKFELVELDLSRGNRRTVARGEIEEIGPGSTHEFIGPEGLKTAGARPITDHREAGAFALA